MRDERGQSLGRLVDAVDEFLEEHVHSRFPAGDPYDRVDALRNRARLKRTRAELRQTTAGLLFLRNKLDAEQTERRVRMARACHALLRAVREDDDESALPLLTYRDTLREHIRHAEQELAGVRTQAADAKEALSRLDRGLQRMETRRARSERRRHRRARHR